MVYGHFRRWSRSGLWVRIMLALPRRSRQRLNMVDATPIRVHHHGANPAGGQEAQAMGHTKGGLNTKLHAFTFALAQPQSHVLTAGLEAYVTHAPTSLENATGTHVLMDRA
jgi:glutamate 5-kinase